MAIFIEVTCAMCGREHPENGSWRGSFQVPSVDREQIIEKLRSRGWTIQQNGANTDVYCSEECAK